MTAHAVRALAKLRLSPRRQRSLLDTTVLSSAARWLLRAQQGSGLFREDLPAADQRYNDTGDVMLTSHALLALAEVAKAQDRKEPEDGDHSETLEVRLNAALLVLPACYDKRTTLVLLLTFNLFSSPVKLDVHVSKITACSYGKSTTRPTPTKQTCHFILTCAVLTNCCYHYTPVPHLQTCA